MTIFGLIGRYWVRSTPQFDEDCRAASAMFNKFQLVLGGLRHRIALGPEAGADSGVGDGLLIMKVLPDRRLEAPGVSVLYKYDEANIYLLRLRVVGF
jgi:hypothetical protein